MFYELDQNGLGDAKCLVFTSVGFFRQDVALMVTTVGMSSHQGGLC